MTFTMRDTVARYSTDQAEKLLSMYDRAVRARGAHSLTAAESVEYAELHRRLRGRAHPSPTTTASP